MIFVKHRKSRADIDLSGPLPLWLFAIHTAIFLSPICLKRLSRPNTSVSPARTVPCSRPLPLLPAFLRPSARRSEREQAPSFLRPEREHAPPSRPGPGGPGPLSTLFSILDPPYGSREEASPPKGKRRRAKKKAASGGRKRDFAGCRSSLQFLE